MSKKVMKKSGKKSAPKRKLSEYKPVKEPKNPHPKGLFALKRKHGKHMGKTCLICHKAIAKRKNAKGGPAPILCLKKDCFKALRCAYRYDWEHDKLKKPLPKADKPKKVKAALKKAA